MPIPIETSLRLLNGSTPRGSDWWDWWLWVEGPADQLAKVASVTYRLHPTFPSPVKTVRNKNAQFRLEGSGWGEFMIRAEARFESGEVAQLERWLELRDAHGNRQTDQAGAGGRRPTIFISSSVVDGDLVSQLTNALRDQGIDARIAQDLATEGSDPSCSVENALKAADGVIAVFSEPRSTWVEHEFQKALDLNLPTFPVIRGKTFVPRAAEQMAHFELTDAHAVGSLADMISARLKDKLVPE